MYNFCICCAAWVHTFTFMTMPSEFIQASPNETHQWVKRSRVWFSCTKQGWRERDLKLFQDRNSAASLRNTKVLCLTSQFRLVMCKDKRCWPLLGKFSGKSEEMSTHYCFVHKLSLKKIKLMLSLSTGKREFCSYLFRSQSWIWLFYLQLLLSHKGKVRSCDRRVALVQINFRVEKRKRLSPLRGKPPKGVCIDLRTNHCQVCKRRAKGDYSWAYRSRPEGKLSVVAHTSATLEVYRVGPQSV